MGLLSDNGPIQSFQSAKQQQPLLKAIGLRQFFHLFKLYYSWRKPQGSGHIKWGEQIEGHFLQLDAKGKLELCRQEITEEYKDVDFPLMFEYGSWMFEMIPKEPYNSNIDSLYETIVSIRHKYKALQSRSRIALTIPVIPFLGVQQFDGSLGVQRPFVNTITRSKYVDDGHIANHPRFRTHTSHSFLRRGASVQSKVPIFMDTNTSLQELAKSQPYPGFIHMDAQVFGTGNCCLQATFSTKSLDHARYVYDQLNVLSPIFLAITAGSPFFKGKVSDWDCRWDVISDTCDDRTPQQRDPHHSDYIPCSRHNQANYYLWDSPTNLKEYNDFYTGVKQEDIDWVHGMAQQEQINIDDRLVYHLANIFKRDFMIAHQKFKLMSSSEFLLFEMINGTNWNSVRLKIPTDDQIGWRVEFRTMEVQLTPDENSAYILFIHMITRELHENTDINLYIPISQLRENFRRAHTRDGVRQQKFYFRTNIYDKGPPLVQQLTIYEILFGKGNYKGLIEIIQRPIKRCQKVSIKVQTLIQCIKKFMLEIALGERLTLAQWMRNYVKQHPAYSHNSILSKPVMDDLVMQLYRISCNQVQDNNFREIFPSEEKWLFEKKIMSSQE